MHVRAASPGPSAHHPQSHSPPLTAAPALQAQFHIKAAKSNVHTRMRQRLVTLRQQLSLARQPAPAQLLC